MALTSEGCRAGVYFVLFFNCEAVQMVDGDIRDTKLIKQEKETYQQFRMSGYNNRKLHKIKSLRFSRKIVIKDMKMR